MPIQLVDFPEPLSPASARLSADTGMIDSDASRVLSVELDRYCRGELAGRSFLISGHRGAGKTTLVLNAYQGVRNQRDRRQEVRPLLVPVNGPALFRPREAAATPGQKDDGAAAKDPPAPGGQAPPGNGDPPAPNAQGGKNPASPGAGAPPGAKPPSADPPAGAKPPSPDAKDPDDALQPWQFALKQIVLALHRAVAEEMSLSHRQRVLDTTDAASVARREGLELSAQLEMELFECPMPGRLREFWARAGLMKTGVLFQPQARILDERPDQAMRELLALSGVCEAYCRVSGTFTEQEKRSENAARQVEASLAASNASSPLLAPVASLLAGALVGVGAAAADASGAAALASGIASALGAAAVFKYSSSRSSARSLSREMSFMPDLSERTLDRFVPLLVTRLVRAGLAPVFVVDELDKVDGLPELIVDLLRGLKKIFAETAFFCFVTDRRYFEELRRTTSDGSYPPSSTYFSHQLFIVYAHDDLHRYLRTRLIPVRAPLP